ncbi:MAG: hypothetical protein ACRC0S_05135 [Fusobacteriaceae bacterium]
MESTVKDLRNSNFGNIKFLVEMENRESELLKEVLDENNDISYMTEQIMICMDKICRYDKVLSSCKAHMEKIDEFIKERNENMDISKGKMETVRIMAKSSGEFDMHKGLISDLEKVIEVMEDQTRDFENEKQLIAKELAKLEELISIVTKRKSNLIYRIYKADIEEWDI